MLKWIKCTNWNDLPVGKSIVKLKKERNNYHIATVSINSQDQRLVIVGNCFHWDVGDIEAYSDFNEYDATQAS